MGLLSLPVYPPLPPSPLMHTVIWRSSGKGSLVLHYWATDYSCLSVDPAFLPWEEAVEKERGKKCLVPSL